MRSKKKQTVTTDNTGQQNEHGELCLCRCEHDHDENVWLDVGCGGPARVVRSARHFGWWGREGAGRHRTITSYFVVITSVCSLLSNGMSGMRMSNESPPDPMRMACHSGVGVAWNTLVPDDDVAMILKTIYSSTSKEDLAG